MTTAREVRALFLAAMAVFVVTVSIGILNGLDLVTFDRNTLLTHVHAGTLGWITLSVFATCLWLLAPPAAPAGRLLAGRPVHAWLTGLAIVAVPVYVLAFFSGAFTARAIFAVPVLAAIVGMLGWVVGQARSLPPTIPRLALVAGITTLTIGGIFGTLVQIQFATGREVIGSAGAIGAHVTAMAFSYLVLLGMALAEWRLAPPGDRLSQAGIVQVASLFLGGLLLTIGALTNNQALLSLNLLFQLIAVAIFIARLGRIVLGVNWLAAGSARHLAASAVFVVVDIGLLVFLIAQLLSGAYGQPGQDPSLLAIPPWLIFALDHAIFVGVMSNAIFGLVRELSRARASMWAWADHVVFWGMNAGLVGFVVGLAVDAVVIKRLFSPIMGVSILIGLFVFAVRLTRTSQGEVAAAAA